MSSLSITRRKASWLLAGALGVGVALAMFVDDSHPTATATPDAAAVAAPDTGAMPASHPQVAADAPTRMAGAVAEVIQVEGYTYLRVTRSAGEFWAAVPTATIAVGDKVSIANPARMTNFVSRSLSRTFPEIIFGELGTSPQALPAGHTAPTHPPTHRKAEAAGVHVKPAQGPGAHTVAEIHAQAAQLAGTPVRVAARVVRVTPNVLGRTWLHIQDGSGQEADEDHDLVVTTKDTPQVGEDVLVRGLVSVNKDLGSGYQYAALIEDAHIERISRN